MGVLVRAAHDDLCMVLTNEINIFLAGIRNQRGFFVGAQSRAAVHCSILPMAAVTVYHTRRIRAAHPTPAAPRAKRLLRPAGFRACDFYAFSTSAAHLVDPCGHFEIAADAPCGQAQQQVLAACIRPKRQKIESTRNVRISRNSAWIFPLQRFSEFSSSISDYKNFLRL